MTFGTWRLWDQLHAPAIFTPRKCSWYSFFLGADSTPLKNPVTPPGIEPGIVRLVAQRLNHYATSGPKWGLCLAEILFRSCPWSSTDSPPYKYVSLRCLQLPVFTNTWHIIKSLPPLLITMLGEMHLSLDCLLFKNRCVRYNLMFLGPCIMILTLRQLPT